MTIAFQGQTAFRTFLIYNFDIIFLNFLIGNYAKTIQTVLNQLNLFSCKAFKQRKTSMGSKHFFFSQPQHLLHFFGRNNVSANAFLWSFKFIP
jgi:hypothetical protein